MICLTLLPALGAAPTANPCAWAHLELAGRAGVTLPDLGLSRAFTLPRARVAGGLRLGNQVGARVELAAVRSGGDAGYIGVDGESIVPAVVVAEGQAALPAWGLALGAGVIDDPWVTGGDQAWGERALAPGLGEAFGWMDSSDLGGWLSFTAPERYVTARIDLTTGEGARYRERNEGKDLAGTVTARPIPGHPEALVLTLYGRDGSRGLGLARDHRVGARVSTTVGPVAGGVEGLAAWGVGGDAERAPLGAAAWTVVRPWGPVVLAGRVDLASEALDDPDAGTRTALAAAGVAMKGQAAELLFGWTGTRVGSAVATIAGAEALQSSDTVFVQLSVRLQAGAELSPARNEPRPDDR